MSLDLKVIDQRSKKLEEGRKFLKTQFFGVDHCIDKFIDSVKMWYIMPELQMRPVIVNMFGITGSGKTDLIRKFVNFIDFTDRFCEIQMDSKEGNATIEDYLDTTLSYNESGVLLLDEIQRFRSVDEEGKEGNSTKYQDLWMLLSDGVLQSNSSIKQELLAMMVEDEYWDERTEKEPTDKKGKEAAEKKKKLKYKMYYYEAMRLKKFLKLEEDVETIMTLTKEQKRKLIKEKINSKEIYEGKKYNKLLIVISGNLDEAFKDAKNVDDADLDADVYHAISKTIDIVQIKKALKKRFKPEQIARFGNIHIIYPILDKKSNYEIIRQKVELIQTNIKKIHGIDISFDESVHEVIYANGVFPTQGVRPLLSTISAIVENSIPTFLFEYIKSDNKKEISITHKNGKLISEINGVTISYEVPRVLDDIKSKDTENKLSLTAVHEAGHAVAYAVLNKTCPTQIVASTADIEYGGFVGTHGTLGSKTNMLNDIVISFAGRAAEEIVFGKDLITHGASSDYMHATERLGTMIRRYGMGEFYGVYWPVSGNKETFMDSHIHIDAHIEMLAKKLYAESLALVKKNADFLIETASQLFIYKKIKKEEFREIARPFIGEIGIVDSGDKIEVNYSEVLRAKISERNTKKSKKITKTTKVLQA